MRLSLIFFVCFVTLVAANRGRRSGGEEKEKRAPIDASLPIGSDSEKSANWTDSVGRARREDPDICSKFTEHTAEEIMTAGCTAMDANAQLKPDYVFSVGIVDEAKWMAFSEAAREFDLHMVFDQSNVKQIHFTNLIWRSKDLNVTNCPDLESVEFKVTYPETNGYSWTRYWIRGNPKLKSIRITILNRRIIKGYIIIEDNPELETVILDASELRPLDGGFQIINNTKLHTFDLSQFTYFDTNIFKVENTALVDVDLSRLDFFQLTHQFVISKNNNLEKIKLPEKASTYSLENINARISHNVKLKEFGPLVNWRKDTKRQPKELEVKGNPRLSSDVLKELMKVKRSYAIQRRWECFPEEVTCPSTTTTTTTPYPRKSAKSTSSVILSCLLIAALIL